MVCLHAGRELERSHTGQDGVLGRAEGKQEPAGEDVVLDTVRGRQEPDTEDVVLGTHQDMQGLTMRSTGWPRSSQPWQSGMVTGAVSTVGTTTFSSGPNATSVSCPKRTRKATGSDCWRGTRPGTNLARFLLTTPTIKGFWFRVTGFKGFGSG